MKKTNLKIFIIPFMIGLCLSLCVLLNIAKAQDPTPIMQKTNIIENKIQKQTSTCPTGNCQQRVPQPYYSKPNSPVQNLNAIKNQNGPENILLVLDASYSMNAKIGSERKIDIAKRVIYNTLRQIPSNKRIGLRVYGHKIGLIGLYPCRKTELVVPVSFNSKDHIFKELPKIQPTGQTPISYSLKTAVQNDFIGLNGPKRIILISDGMETCDGNPCDYAVEMVRQGIDFKIDVVGFALRQPAAINQLKCVALSTDGKFFTADTEASLAKSLQNSFQSSKNVQGFIVPRR